LPDIISKLFKKLIAAQEYFPDVQCHWNNFEIISAADIIISVLDVVTCEIKRLNNLGEIISVFYFRCNHHQWTCEI